MKIRASNIIGGDIPSISGEEHNNFEEDAMLSAFVWFQYLLNLKIYLNNSHAFALKNLVVC